MNTIDTSPKAVAALVAAMRTHAELNFAADTMEALDLKAREEGVRADFAEEACRRIEAERDDYHRKACDIADERDQLRAKLEAMTACHEKPPFYVDLEKLVTERDELRKVCLDFIAKCDRGEARSVRTYSAMKKALGLE